MSTIANPVVDRAQLVRDVAHEKHVGSNNDIDESDSETWDGSLREGRNEFTLDIEGIDFHIVYDCASTGTGDAAAATRRDGVESTAGRVAHPDTHGTAAGAPIPTTRVERVDDKPSHGEVPGTAAHDIRSQDAAADEMVVATDDGTKRSSRPAEVDQTAEGRTPMPEVPITRVELVDGEPSHGDVPGTVAHDIRKEDAVPDEMEVVPEPLPGMRSIGKKPFVLLSHALMADLRMWDSTVKALNEEGYDCIRYDHVGHGGKNGTGRKSEEWKGRRWHFDEFARHMKTIVDRIRPGEEPTAVVGCSMGGTLAMRYAMLFPPKQEGRMKVVCIGAPGLKSLEESKPKWEERKKVFKGEGVEVLARRTSERWLPQPVQDGVRGRAEDMCRGCSLEGYERCAEGIVNYQYDSKEEVEGLRDRKGIEILVVRGEKDEAVGPKSILEGVARRVGGRFEAMKDVGHLPPMHDEDGFEKLLLEFLRS